MLKALVFVMAVMIPAAVCHAGPAASGKKVLTLKLQAKDGTVYVEFQKLGSNTWPDKTEQAHYKITRKAQTREDAAGIVSYTISKGVLSATIPVNREAFESGFTIELTGVSDSKGVNHVTVFRGTMPPRRAEQVTAPQARLQPAVQSDGASSATTPSPTGQANVQPSSTPALSKAENDGSASGSVASDQQDEAKNRQDWVIYAGGAVSLALLLAIGWLALRQLSRSKLQPGQVPQFEILEIKQTAKSAQTSGENALKEINQLKTAIAGLQERPTVSRKEIEELVGSSIESRLGSPSDLERLAGKLNIPGPSNSAQSASLEKMQVKDWERTALTAVVNRWWAGGSQDIKNLLQLAANLNLKVTLATHKDLNQVFQDVTTFEYPFASSEQGPWLLASIPNTAEVWAAPIDQSYFRMGLAPALLNRLFEGIDNNQRELRFARLYQPCRLQLVTGKSGVYLVMQRGILQLRGAPAPDFAQPQEYSSLPMVRTQSTDASSRAARSKVVTESLLELADRLRTLEAELSAVQQQVQEQLAGTKQQNQGSDIETLKSNLDRLEQRINIKLEEIQAAIEQSKKEQSKREERQTFTEKSEAIGNPQPRLAAGNRLNAVAPESPPLEQTDEQIPAPNSPLSARMSIMALPVSWQEAWCQAAGHPASEPSVNDVPTPVLYIRRVKALANALAALSPEVQIGIVHLKKHASEDTFELHKIEHNQENPEYLYCSTCNSRQSWQAAVCGGAVGAEDVSIVYPHGQFGKGNYAPGYSALIDDLTGATFFIAGIEQPAELRLLRDSGAYEVRRKMTWTKSAQATGGRP